MKKKSIALIASLMAVTNLTSCALKGAIKTEDKIFETKSVPKNSSNSKNNSQNLSKANEGENKPNTIALNTMALTKGATQSLTLANRNPSESTRTVVTFPMKKPETKTINTLPNREESLLSYSPKTMGGVQLKIFTILFKNMLFALDDEYYNKSSKRISYITKIRDKEGLTNLTLTVPKNEDGLQNKVMQPGNTSSLTGTKKSDETSKIPQIKEDTTKITEEPTTTTEEPIVINDTLKAAKASVDAVQIGRSEDITLVNKDFVLTNENISQINGEQNIAPGDFTPIETIKLGEGGKLQISFYNMDSEVATIKSPNAIIYSYMITMAEYDKEPIFIPGGFELAKAKIEEIMKHYEMTHEFYLVEEKDGFKIYEAKEIKGEEKNDYATRYYVDKEGIVLAYEKVLKKLPEVKAPVTTTIPSEIEATTMEPYPTESSEEEVTSEVIEDTSIEGTTETIPISEETNEEENPPVDTSPAETTIISQ